MSSDLSSKAAAHSGKYGFEVTVTEVFTKNWHGLLSLPAFLVTDHERMYTLTFWAKVSLACPVQSQRCMRRDSLAESEGLTETFHADDLVVVADTEQL